MTSDFYKEIVPHKPHKDSGSVSVFLLQTCMDANSCIMG